jgi:hypothetical protein
MKMGIEMVKDGFTLLNVTDITSIISGSVYMFERPKNSVKQDIVLNTLALTNDQLQQGVFNVNIHSPNVKGVVIAGETDNTLPDTQFLLDTGKKVAALLYDYAGPDFSLSVQTPGLPLRDTDGTWYLNIRVNYYAFQTNYTNI